MTIMPRRGLYVITAPPVAGAAPLLDAVRAAVEGGAVVVQYRDKGTDHPRRLAEVRALHRYCRGVGVPLIVNDDVALAAQAGADGVHLGRDDADVGSARDMLGAGAIIGVSCYDDVARALAAERAGADYVAFGRFFPSASKPHATPAGLQVLRAARALVRVPVVAIGGITAANAGLLLEAGAGLLAVIGSVVPQPDPRAAAAAFAPLFADINHHKETA